MGEKSREEQNGVPGKFYHLQPGFSSHLNILVNIYLPGAFTAHTYSRLYPFVLILYSKFLTKEIFPPNHCPKTPLPLQATLTQNCVKSKIKS